MINQLTLGELSILLMLILNLAGIGKFWVSWERRMTTMETYIRLIMPKLGITLVDSPHRRDDHIQ